MKQDVEMETIEPQPQYRLSTQLFFLGWEWLAVSTQNQQRVEKTEGAPVRSG